MYQTGRAIPPLQEAKPLGITLTSLRKVHFLTFSIIIHQPSIMRSLHVYIHTCLRLASWSSSQIEWSPAIKS